jgi:hypothetical protein
VRPESESESDSPLLSIGSGDAFFGRPVTPPLALPLPYDWFREGLTYRRGSREYASSSSSESVWQRTRRKRCLE